MESRAFIKYAGELIRKIESVHPSSHTDEEAKQVRIEVQRDMTQLFQGLQNPTLPSASNLRDVALANGYTIEAKVLHRLQQADPFWQQ